MKPLLFTLILTMAPLAAQDNALAARLQVLEDRAAIERILVDYGRFLDARRLADYAGLFARDGVWTGGFGTFKTPKGIQEAMEKALGTGPNENGSHHILSNFAIEVKGDSATAWSRWAFVVPGANKAPTIAQSGRYEDTLVREAGKWKFLRREAFNDIPAGGPGGTKN